MGWDYRDHYSYQFIKLCQGEVGQSFERIQCGLHCSQNISKTNSWVQILPCPPFQFHAMWKNCGSCKQPPCNGNNHIFFVHIFHFFFIAWGRGEMIVIRRRNMVFVLRKHLWFQMKMKRNVFGKNFSLYSLHENPKLHGWILHPTYSKPKPAPLWLSFFSSSHIQVEQNLQTTYLKTNWSFICI
jgi:hypothetical protein